MSQLKENAEKAFRQGFIAECIGLYQQYLDENPPDLGSLLFLAKAYMLAGIEDQAIGCYDKAITLEPSHATADTRRTCHFLQKTFPLTRPAHTRPRYGQQQISMRSLGHKGRFGNQIFQYSFLKTYSNLHGIAAGTVPWIGNYVFDIHDSLPATPLEMTRERSMDIKRVLSGDPGLMNKDITGYFQFHTSHWQQHKTYLQQLFKPRAALDSIVRRYIEKIRIGDGPLIAVHIRRGDVKNLGYRASPSKWYLEWLREYRRNNAEFTVYVASDSPEAIEEFSEFNPHSYSEDNFGFKGFEAIADWLVIRASDIICASNSTFSISAAFASSGKRRYFRPDFSTQSIVAFDPWNCDVITPEQSVRQPVTPDRNSLSNQKMVHPSVKRFVEGRTYFGLNDLDKKLEKHLDYDNGYYVELGANDGFNQSNTLFFERSRGWRGVLIEPIPKNYRKCFLIRSEDNHIFNAACVSFGYEEKKVRLKYANLMTTPIGLESDIDNPLEHANSGIQYLRKNDQPFEIDVDARTLHSILDEANAPSLINLLSLDVEGAEIEVLKGIDHNKYRFEKILVECRSFESMNAYLQENGYELLDQLTHHDYLFHDVRNNPDQS